MEPWEESARELFPNLYTFRPGRRASIYSVLGDLCGRCSQALANGDTEEVRKVFTYVEWCFDHEDNDIWNASVTSFYEHLHQDPVTYQAMPEWVRPDIFWGMSELLTRRMGEANYSELKRRYIERRGPDPEES